MRWLFAATLAFLLTSPRAGAEPINYDTPPRARGGATAALSPDLLPLRVTLSIEPSDPSTTWVLRIENSDTVPVHLVTDWRLLTLEVLPPPSQKAAHGTVHCVLPPEMRAAADETHLLVLPPKTAQITVVDPRAFCFGTTKEHALAPGATVVAHFGFVPDRSASQLPPFVVVPAGASSERAGVKELISDPFTLQEPPPPDHDTVTSEPPKEPTIHDETLSVSTPSRVDAGNVRDLALTVTVTNRSRRRVTLLLSPHTIAIEATNHAGVTFPCQWEMPPAPIAELFTSIPPMGHASTQVLVGAICPPIFLAAPGLYTLRASLDTRGVSGESIGIPSFVGKVTASESSLVRIRTTMRGMPLQP